MKIKVMLCLLSHDIFYGICMTSAITEISALLTRGSNVSSLASFVIRIFL